jgi:spore maturation protein CgeB
MRIFYAAPNSPNSQLRSNFWRANLRASLVKLGHEIVDFEFDLDRTFQNLDPADPVQREFISRNRPRLSDALVSQVRKAHTMQPVDLFFSYFYNACVEPGVIRQIGSLGIMTTNWFCNASYQFQLVSEIAPEYDFCLVPEKFRLEDYRRAGAKPIYCQEAANPEVYRRHPGPEIYDVGFVGQAYGERPALIEWLADHRVDVRVWGQGWEYFRKRRPSFFGMRRGKDDCVPKIAPRLIGGILSDEELVRTFSRTKINLGFAGCWTNENTSERITQIRLRDFEVPMSGGFYLTEYQDELEEFFEIDSEIACYRNKDELLEKIGFYLKRPDLRERIRSAGRRRCLSDHTWERRFEAVFKQMQLRT